MEACGATFSTPLTTSTKALAEPHSLDHVNMEPNVQNREPVTGIIHDTEDTLTSCVLHEDLESTDVFKPTDHLLEQGLTQGIFIGGSDEVVCFSEASEGDHHCEHPGCSQSFPTRRTLL